MKTLPDPIHCIDQQPLASLKERTSRPRLQRFAWNLEVIREQIPEGFSIEEAEVCLSQDNQGYIATKLDSSDKPRLHAAIRGLMHAQRIDRGAAGLFRDHVLYDNRGRTVYCGNTRERELAIPQPHELRAGLDIRTIYATGAPPMGEEKAAPKRSRNVKGFLACAVLGAATAAAGVGAWLLLRRDDEDDKTETEPPDTVQSKSEPDHTQD